MPFSKDWVVAEKSIITTEPQSLLLARMIEKDARIAPLLEHVQLRQRQTISSADELAEYVYFPLS